MAKIRVVLTGAGGLSPYRWEDMLRRIAIYVHRLGVETGLEAEREAAPKLTGELARSIASEPLVRAGRSEFLEAIVTRKPDAHFSWVETKPIIRPVKSSVLVFPILPQWRPKHEKELSEKELREKKIITAWVRGRAYNPWRERGMEDAVERLERVLGRLRLQPILEV